MNDSTNVAELSKKRPTLGRWPRLRDDPFVARGPWLNADLQTIRNFLIVEGLGRGAEPPPSVRIDLPLQDGTGDSLIGDYAGGTGRRGLVILVHGLSGCAASAYMKASAAAFHAAGFDTLRLNLRGAGPSAGASTDCYHSGRTEDLANALLALRRLKPGTFRRNLFFVGFSLGGNMLLKFLADYAKAFPITAAATVCAPIDLAEASRWFGRSRNRIYQRALLNWMRRDAVRLPLGDVERIAIRSARSVRQFDEGFTAPRFGFVDADDYYAKCSARYFLTGIEAPSLLVEARDDPWVPSVSYDRVDWNVLPRLHRLSAGGGGHVGFHGKGSETPWHDRKIIQFFDWVAG